MQFTRKPRPKLGWIAVFVARSSQAYRVRKFIAYLNERDKVDSMTWWGLVGDEEKHGLPFGRLCGPVDGRLTAYRRMRTKLRQMKTRLNKKVGR
jgi:hypothetical protein